jgi:membrane protease YdiL (CAAX protease family)
VIYQRHKILSIALLAEGAVLAAALIAAEYFDIEFLPLTDNVFRDITIGTAGAVLPFVFFLFLVSEKASEIPFVESLRKIVLTTVTAMFSKTRFIDILIISLSAGVAEEFLFRGIIQAKAGILIASLVFGLAHFISPLYFIVAAVMGFYMGIFFYVYNSLLIPVQIHFIYDLGALVYLRYFMKERKDE